MKAFFLYFLVSVIFYGECLAETDFVKKKILFLSWGDGDRQIGIYHEDNNDGCDGPTSLGVDGNGNIYILDTQNQRVLEFSSSGNFIRQLNCDRGANEMIVDGEGDVFLPGYDPSNKSKLMKFTCVTPDDRIIRYPIVWSDQIDNGVIYDLAGNAAQVLKPSDDESLRKLPITIGFKDYQIDHAQEKIMIKTEKIKKRMGNRGQNLQDEISVDLAQREGVKSVEDILGIDDAGNIYEICGFYKGKLGVSVDQESVFVFSLDGKLQAEIPVQIDECAKEGPFGPLFKIDIQGNLYQLSTSEQGVCVYKWTRE